MNIHELQDRAYSTNESKGFHESSEDLNIPCKLMLVVSELSEALEEYRNNKPAYYLNDNSKKPEGVGVEIADAVIRLADICGILKIDLNEMINLKMDYNDTRPYRHGGKRI